MKRLAIAAVVMFCGWSVAATAAVQVSEQILQSGRFVKESCKAEDPDYDNCTCDADVRYPQLSGVTDVALQTKLNGWFKEQAGKAICEGKSAGVSPKDGNKDGKTSMSVSVHYETTFNAANMLSFKFTDWAFTGGAHGNGSVFGAIIDLNRGKILTPADIFPVASLPALNKAIYEALSAKPEEEVFRDRVESRKDAFIKDGQCQGCTLILTPEGLHVLFQTYEVAPYSSGNTDIMIPAANVGDPIIAKALNAKQPVPEKK